VTEHAKLLARLAVAVAARAGELPLTLRLCEACRELLGADGASITVENANLNRVTIAATDRVAAQLEDWQDVLGQGPGWDAFRSARAVVSVLGEESRQRWPLLSEAVAQHLSGSLRVYAFPMRPTASVLGVLTLVRNDRGELGSELATAQFLSDTVGAALLQDPLSHADFGEGGPWSERAEIHQATGVVCAQLQVEPADALALLKAHAYAQSLDLSAVARLVISWKLDFRDGG
jgi:hypothetical protein